MRDATRTVQWLTHEVTNRATVTRPVFPHVLRHAFVVSAIQRGLSLSHLQKIFGNDYLGMTNIYLNPP
jgi:site-specific recombinase XerD